MIKKLIVNGDDFGYSKGVNVGIIHGHKYGIITSTTIMMNMSEIDHGLDLIKEYPNLGLGIHLVLTAGKPICKDVKSLVNENGDFNKLSDLVKYAKLEDIEKEFRFQIEKFLSYKLKPTHIDSHHHVHFDNEILPIVLRLAEEYELALRIPNKDILKKYNYSNIKSADYFTSDFYDKKLNMDNIDSILKLFKKYDVIEMMTHPAYADDKLLNLSSYNTQRENELLILTNSIIANKIKELDIHLVSYKDI